MSAKQECNPGEHDFLYDENEEYRICWLCDLRQKKIWVNYKK